MVWDRVVVYRRCTFGEGEIFLIGVKADGFLEFATWLLFAVLQRKTQIFSLLSRCFDFRKRGILRSRLASWLFFCCRNSQRRQRRLGWGAATRSGL
jgi:hypothetical protein